MVFAEKILARVVIASATAILATDLACAEESRNGFDYSDALVPAEEIIWGGVPRDGIPPIHDPKFIPATEADFMRGKDRVLGVARNGIAKAYPIKILDRHEVVNDKFGDESIVVTYCPLCLSGMSFVVQFGESDLKFGVSGLLYNSDVLLYDYRTGSLWSQLLSVSISGPLKGYGIPAIPTAHTTWRDWQARHPDTKVLSTDTGYRMNYRDSPYSAYKSSGRLMYPVAEQSDAYRRKEYVLGITIDGVDKAYPFKELRKHDQESFADIIGGRELVIEWLEDERYARVVDKEGTEITSVIVYWFAWYAFHPDTEVFVAAER